MRLAMQHLLHTYAARSAQPGAAEKMAPIVLFTNQMANKMRRESL
jgi:hypothetical protein